MHVMGSVSPANEREAFSFQEDAAAAVVPPSPAAPAPSGGHAPAPPPPPPPLPFPGLGEPGGRNQKKRVRSFFWKTIPEEQVKGRPNLWTQGRELQYQIDVQTIEELFGQSSCQSETRATTVRGGKSRSSLRETKEEVSILDSKRGMNIGIFLKQFKKSTQMIIDDVCNGNSEPYGAEPLRELLKLLPDPDEVKKLRAYRGDVSRLSMADSFLYQLVLLPSYSVRIESMLLKEEFPSACEAMTRDISILRCATRELMCCDELHAVLHLVLQAGNILNAGGYAGNALGFKLSSLLALADTKANKPGMNLLHFVALEAQKKDEKLLEFPLKLPHVQSAARISLETLDADLQWLTGRTQSVEESVQRDTELLQQLDDFLQSATTSLCSLRHGRQQLRKEGSELIDFFCEDRDAFRLDDCFSIFHTFCSRFTSAVKENVEREAKEAAYRRRLQQVEEQKRHSWAGGEEMVGAFRLHRSDSDMAQHGKAGLLMKPLPHSPPGRWGSLRRSRGSPSNSPSLAAERDLSAFLEMGAHSRKVGHQRGGVPFASYEAESGRLSPQTPAQRNTNLSYLSYDGVKPTSDLNQQCDHNNNDNDQLHRGFITLSDHPSEPPTTNQHSTAATGTMSVVLETCTLVPELKVFDSVTDRRNQGDGLDGAREQKVQNYSHVGEVDQFDSRSSSHREEDKGGAEKVVVWCVTGVCKAAGEQAGGTSTQPEKDQCRGDNQGGNQQISSVAGICQPSEAQPANKKPVPISSQPVPVSRCDDLSPHASSPGWSPTKPEPAEEVTAFTTVASDEGNAGETSRGEGASRNENKCETLLEPAAQQNHNHAGSTNKSSTKNLRKTQATAMKPTTSSVNKAKPVRTLTSSESQDMRRVVPISRTGRNVASMGKGPETPTSLSLKGSFRPRERPSTAPSSRRSSFNKTPELKASAASATPRQKQDFQRRQSMQKAPTKAKAQPEEKMCRSTLRALTLAGDGGGGRASVSAPATPLHKGTTWPTSPLPGFARSTASSSFRRTSTILTPTGSPQSHSSPRSTPSSAAPAPIGSLRVSTSRSSDVPDPKRSQSSRARPNSPLPSSMASPKGHQRNDSVSDRSTRSRDSGRTPRAACR